MAESALESYQRHHNNLMDVATKVISKELEVNAIRQHIPKESAARETMSYHVAEEIMLDAQDNYSIISRDLGNVTAAKNYMKRTIELKEKNLLGDPKKQEGARNMQTREYRMVQDEGWQTLYGDLRISEELSAYLERLSSSSLETLNVAKKLYDSASRNLERERGGQS